MRPIFSRSIIIILLIVSSLFSSCTKSSKSDTPSAGPGITALSATTGAYYNYVTIYGNGFGSEINNVKVFFNDKPALVIEVNPTSIGTAVPLDAGTGNISITVNGTKFKGPVFTYKKANIIYTVAGSNVQGYVDGPGKSAEFHSTIGIVLDKANNMFVADSQNGAVRKITPDGNVSTFALFSYIKAIAIDNADNLYVANGSNISKITPDGKLSALNYVNGIHQGPSLQVSGMAIDNAGIIYLCDQTNYRILKIGADGILVPFAGLAPGSADGNGTAASFNAPTAMICDKDGNVYVCDGATLIRKITPDGTVTTYAGGALGLKDGAGTSAGFKSPRGITIDQTGNLYIADTGDDAIRKIDVNRNVTTLVSNNGNYVRGIQDGEISKAQEAGPLCITVGKDGRLYIGDGDGTYIRSTDFR